MGTSCSLLRDVSYTRSEKQMAFRAYTEAVQENNTHESKRGRIRRRGLCAWLVIVLLLVSCDDGGGMGEVDPTPTPALAVTGLTVTDTGDGTTIRIAFTKAGDEAKVRAYCVLVVKVDNAQSFNLNAANAVPANRYTVVPKTGSVLSTTVSAGTNDTDGDAIAPRSAGGGV